ncbi:hypothetical protein C0993_000664 [Termitomyces sp. T159_Od127]|nr:hypothetical protein C0993_000664 [Termitomyces sp. T159_Od127]
MEQDQQPSLAEQRMALAAKLKRAASLPRMKDGRRPPMHSDAVSEGEKACNGEEVPAKENNTQASDQAAAQDTTKANGETKVQAELEARDIGVEVEVESSVHEPEIEAEAETVESGAADEEERAPTTRTKRRSRSRARSRGSKDLRAKARAAQSPTPTFQSAGESSQDEAPLRSPINIAPLMSPIPVASHILELQRSRLLRSPTPLSSDAPLAFSHGLVSPIPPPTLEAWQKGLLRSNSAGGRAVGRNLAMQSLTGGTEMYEPSGSTLVRNNTVTGTGERVAARQLMLSRLGGRIVKPDPGDVSIEERSGPSPTPKRRKRRSRRVSQSATTGVSDSEGVLSTSPSTPNAPSLPLPAFDDGLLRSRSTTPFQSVNSSTRDQEENSEPPLPSDTKPDMKTEIGQPEPPKRRSLVIEEDDEDQFPPTQPFLPTRQTAASRFPHALGAPHTEGSHSPSPARVSPYVNQRTTPVVETLPPSPFATPLQDLSSQDDDEEVFYPPYQLRTDDFAREPSWIAEPVPKYDSDSEKRMPIEESNDQDDEQTPLSSNGFAQTEHDAYASPHASFSSRSLNVELETSSVSPLRSSLAPSAPQRESATHTSDESTSPVTYPKRLSVGLPSPDWGEPNSASDNPSTWEKVMGAFSRTGSSSGRRSRTNSFVNRSRADSVSRESGASLNSAKIDRNDTAAQQQAQSLMQSPSASASISSLAAHARTAPSPVPPLTSANKSKYQHAKLFPFGMTTTQEEPNRLPSASISTPDVRISGGNEEETLPVFAGSSQNTSATRERTLSHQTSDTHLVAKSNTSASQAASPTVSRSPSQNGISKLPMTLPGVKQWLSKNKKKFSFNPSSSVTPAPEFRSVPSTLNHPAPDAIKHMQSTDWDDVRTAPGGPIGDFSRHKDRATSTQPRSENTDTEKTPKAKKTITIPPSHHTVSNTSYFDTSPLSPPSRPDPFSSTTPDPSSSLSDYPAHSTSESSSTTSSQYSFGGLKGSIFLEKIDEELARGSRSRIWTTSLGDPPRKLVIATPVTQVVDQNTLKERFLFLFSDILVITKPVFLNQEGLADKDPLSRKFIVKSVVMLNQMRFTEGRIATDASELNGVKQRDRAFVSFVNKFSENPEEAINTLCVKSGRRDDSVAVGQLLFKTWDLDRVRLGEYFVKRTSKNILKVFLDSFEFLGIRVDNALRVLLLSIHIPESTNALEYLLEAFAGRWYEANAGHVDFNKDHTHRFVRAIVQLNGLLHGGIAQEPGITQTPLRNISCDEFVDAFRRYDQKSSVSDGLLRDVYEATVQECLSQSPPSSTPLETITLKRPIPPSLTWRVESEPIILRIPRADPDLVIKLHGHDLVFNPPVLNFAKSPEVSFRVKSNVLGSRSILMRRAGPNAVKYTGLPLSTPVLVERPIMRYTLQIAFANHNGMKRRYMFSVDDSLLQNQCAVHIRRQIEKVAQSSRAGLTFRRAAEIMSFSILQETLLGLPVNSMRKKHSGLKSGPRDCMTANGFRLAPHSVRPKSRSHKHGLARNELDFSQPLHFRCEDDEEPVVERPEGRLWSAKELEMLCEQNSKLADNFRIDWSSPERYEIVRRVGGGKYSEVFEGIDTANNEQCIIKVLKPVAAKKIKREIKVLRNLTGGPNVVALLDVVLDPSCRFHSLIMEYVKNIEWKSLFVQLTESDIKHYTFQLLKALDFVHAHGIMHRDVKPGNVMVDCQRRQVWLAASEPIAGPTKL